MELNIIYLSMIHQSELVLNQKFYNFSLLKIIWKSQFIFDFEEEMILLASQRKHHSKRNINKTVTDLYKYIFCLQLKTIHMQIYFDYYYI